MQVRMEIQHKELGLIMREQKQHSKKSPRGGLISGAATDRAKNPNGASGSS